MDFDDMFKGMFIVWIIAALVSLGVLGVAIWAVISLVNHFT